MDTDMSGDFYSSLDAFTEFEQFTQTVNYRPLPDDWVVVVADIMDSSRAIENGQYKEVNQVGAAGITQTMLVLHTQDIPFVFGGDGATLCIPRSDVDKVSKQLGKLMTLARNNFQLELRVAVIPLEVIRQMGREVLVAKLEITRGKYIALFRGGGLAAADALAKQEYERYGITPVDGSLDELKGLSCRWSPVPSRKGHVVSLLAVSRTTDAMEVYRELIADIREILGREISEANPVHDNLERYKTISEALREEVNFFKSRFGISFLFRSINIVFSVWIFKYGFNPMALFFNASKYKDSIARHSDFRKFDDTLRLILDCTPEELRRLQDMLDRGYREEKLFYGLHATDKALMTCFLESTDQGRHLHFIDGGDGGLAMAAKQLKSQMDIQ